MLLVIHRVAHVLGLDRTNVIIATQDMDGMEITVWLAMLFAVYVTALEITNVTLAKQDIICGKEIPGFLSAGFL